eukprot:gene33428-40436_t
MAALVAAYHSNLVHFVALVVFATTLSIIGKFWISWILPVVYTAFLWKKVIFEFFVAEHVIESQLGTFQWFSVVDDNVLLGAIPLKEDHYEELTKKLGVKLIISVVEPFELETRTLMGTPVKPEQWKAAGVDQVTLSCPDFIPPPFDILEKGAAIMDSYLCNGHRVYVHCKSGKGRSASVVAAYFFKYKNLDMDTVQAKLKSRRPFIFDRNSSQMRNLKAYEKMKRPSSSQLM